MAVTPDCRNLVGGTFEIHTKIPVALMTLAPKQSQLRSKSSHL